MSHRVSQSPFRRVPAAVTAAAMVTATLIMAACVSGEPTAVRLNADQIRASAAGSVDNTTRARFTLADSINVGTASAPVWTPAAVRGDGRLRDGTPAAPGGPSNEYQGNVCSVNAVIGSGLKGEGYQFYLDMARFASSTLPVSCLPTRYQRYYMNGPDQPPVNASPLASIPGISAMAVGQTMIQPLHSGTMAELGYAFFWDDAYPPASSLLVTRLPNVTDEYGRSVRQWRAESRGSHQAALATPATSRKSGQTITGTLYMPWAMTITEVPYPLPSSP